jgi:hypothetical protein
MTGVKGLDRTVGRRDPVQYRSLAAARQPTALDSEETVAAHVFHFFE